MDVMPYADIPDQTHSDREAVIGTQVHWLAAGSIKPTPIDDPDMDARSTVWIRAKCIATYVREIVKSIAPQGTGDFQQDHKPDTGLIICMEGTRHQGTTTCGR